MDIYNDYNDRVIDTGSSAYGFASGMLSTAADIQEMRVEAALDWSISDESFGQMLGAMAPNSGAPAPEVQSGGGGNEQLMAGGFPGRLPLIFNPKTVRRAADLAKRMHGGMRHMTLMWKLTKDIKQLIGTKVSANMIRHNQSLVGPAGQLLSNFRPDVQIIDVARKIIHVGESIVTNGGSQARVDAMRAAVRALGKGWDMRYYIAQ